MTDSEVNNYNKEVFRKEAKKPRNLFSYKVLYKKYRLDRGMWEEKRSLFGIAYYRYSIRRNNLKITISRIRPFPKARYFDKIPQTTFFIGKRDYKKEYDSNKFLIPLNRDLNISSNESYCVTT